MKKELILKNEEESKQFAVTLAKQAKKGDIYFLYGELGQGKLFSLLISVENSALLIMSAVLLMFY